MHRGPDFNEGMRPAGDGGSFQPGREFRPPVADVRSINTAGSSGAPGERMASALPPDNGPVVPRRGADLGGTLGAGSPAAPQAATGERRRVQGPGTPRYDLPMDGAKEGAPVPLPDRVLNAGSGTVKIDVSVPQGALVRIGDATSKGIGFTTIGDGVGAPEWHRGAGATFRRIGQHQLANPPEQGQQPVMEATSFEPVEEDVYGPTYHVKQKNRHV